MDFADLIQRARSGDEVASEELVRGFEPFIQRIVRLRLRRHAKFQPLRHDVGSSDVCQSVFRSLFRGLRENRYELREPRDLERLLQAMIRFNVATKARRSGVTLRKLVDDFEHEGWLDSAPGPEEEVADQDLLEAIQERLTARELELLAMRLDDVSWAEIGRKAGCTAAAARVRLARAVKRVKTVLDAEDRAAT